jgi:hypothetical protein
MNTYIQMMTGTTKLFTVVAFLLGVALLGTLALPTSGSAAGAENPKDLLIVVNTASKVTNLSVDQLREYFLKTRKTWPDGSKVVPVNTREPELRNVFRQKVLSMSASEEQRYWQDQMIRTGEQMPPEFDNALKATFRLSGAVSYVFRKDLLKNVVKVVAVIPAK